MKLKVQQLMDAVVCLTTIINTNRLLPQKGKYRIARMHTKLLVEYKIIDARREDMIKAYGATLVTTETNKETGEVTVTPVPGQWMVPADKMEEYTAAWKVVGDDEIEVDVQPIPLSSLILGDNVDGAIEPGELITLGDLVIED